MAPQEEQEKAQEIRDIPGLSEKEEAVARGSGADDAALKEASQLSSGLSTEALKKDAERREHDRDQRFRDRFDILVMWGMNAAFLAILVMGMVWVWHLIAPDKWTWLSEQKLDHIQGMVTGGVIAVVVGDHFKRRLGKDG